MNNYLVTIYKYEDILDKIHEIIKISEDRGNDLLIMNNTASFGYFLCYEVDKDLAINDFEELKKMNGIDYNHNHLNQRTTKQKDKITTSLQKCASKLSKKGAKIQYITLPTEITTNGIITYPFKDNYLTDTIDNVHIQDFVENTDLSAWTKLIVYLKNCNLLIISIIHSSLYIINCALALIEIKSDL